MTKPQRICLFVGLMCLLYRTEKLRTDVDYHNQQLIRASYYVDKLIHHSHAHEQVAPTVAIETFEHGKPRDTRTWPMAD